MPIMIAQPPYGSTALTGAENPLSANGSIVRLKNNSLTGQKFSKSTISGSSQTISGSMTWTPNAGSYMIVCNSSDVEFELFVEGGWQSGIAGSGLYLMDGSSRRFHNTGVGNQVVYYHRL
jgi:hypothetical protein